jgi:hypothetical protein
MASEVDICNLALSAIGDEATVSSIEPPEGSAQAEHCARFYPMARDTLLEMHDWKFATRRVKLSRLTQDSPPWKGVFAPPNKVLRVIAVFPEGAPPREESAPFEMAILPDDLPVILTDVERPFARCTFRVTDTTRFPPLFVEALSRLLASMLAGPVLKGETGIAVSRAKYQEFMLVLSQAKVSDANQQRIVPAHVPPWLAGRGLMTEDRGQSGRWRGL